MIRADHRKWGQQDCDREQHGPSPFEKRLQPQPEIQSDAGVRPCDRQQRELHRDHIRSCDPITEQRRCIADWNTPVDPSRYPLNSEVTASKSGMLKPKTSCAISAA